MRLLDAKPLLTLPISSDGGEIPVLWHSRYFAKQHVPAGVIHEIAWALIRAVLTLHS